jgi:xylulokinase
VHTLKEEEGGVLGSALLAMVAAGIQPDVPSAARRCVQIERTFHPNPDDFPRYDALFNLFTDLHDRLQAPFDRLSEIE